MTTRSTRLVTYLVLLLALTSGDRLHHRIRPSLPKARHLSQRPVAVLVFQAAVVSAAEALN